MITNDTSSTGCYIPAEAFFFIRLLGASRPTTVTVGAARLRAAASVAALDDEPEGAYVWDERQAAVTIKLSTRSADLSVTVLFEFH